MPLAYRCSLADSVLQLHAFLSKPGQAD